MYNILTIGPGTDLRLFKGKLTQDFLQQTFEDLAGPKHFSALKRVVRFSNGKFEQLSPHKWKNGEGWDDEIPWIERWVPLI